MRSILGWMNGSTGKGGAAPSSQTKARPAHTNGGDVKLDYTSESITTATLAQMATTADPRFKQIWAVARTDTFAPAPTLFALAAE